MSLPWVLIDFEFFKVVEIAVFLAITYLISKIVSKALKKTFDKTPFPEDVEKSIIRASKYAVYVIGFFAVISVVGVDLTSILVGLGAFSIAISFATSNIIQNFVSGIIVMGGRSFKVGDEIKIWTFEGKVLRIGIRTTVIEDNEGNTIFIPNSLFISNPLTRKKLAS